MNNHIRLPSHHVYFQNTVGKLLEHPKGHYIAIEYYQGPRELNETLAFLTHAGQLIARWGWDALLCYGQPVLLPAMTSDESYALLAYWQAQQNLPLALLYGAQLLPHEVFVGLSRRLR